VKHDRKSRAFKRRSLFVKRSCKRETRRSVHRVTKGFWRF